MKLEYFSMLDRIATRDAETLVAEATLPDASPIFEGHFPGFPLLPGVLMIECMAQAGGWLMLARQNFARMPLLAKVGTAKLRGMLRPGARLSISARLTHDGSGYAVMAGRIDSDGQMAAEAEYTLRTLPFPDAALEALVRARGIELGLV